MELDKNPDHIEKLMSFIRNKEVTKFTQYLTDNALERTTFVDSAFDDKCTLLMSASYHGQKEIVQKLLNIGCNVNLQSNTRWTALMFAAHSGHDDIVKMLLEKHAHIDTVNSLGSTALHLATCKGRIEVVRVFLKENANIHLKDNAGWTVRLIAKKKCFLEIEKSLADYEKLQENTKKCIMHNDKKYLEEQTVKSKTFLNSKFEDECTLLMFASHHGTKEIVDFLLKQGCEVNCKSSAGWTALMFAAHVGHEDIVQVLLDHKADIDAVNNEGSTALHLATTNNQISIVKQLLDRNANAEIKNITGLNAIKIANLKGFQSICNALIATKKVQAKIMNSIREKDVKQFLEIVEENNLNNKTFFEYDFDKKYTLLMFASHHGAKEIVDFLLKQGCEVNCKSIAGWTALMFAALAGHEDIVKVLLDHKADIDAVNNEGSTALHLATASKQISIVKQLLDRNANTKIEDNKGNSASKLADLSSFQPISDLFNETKKFGQATSHGYTSTLGCIPFDKIHPKYLHSNSTIHTWAFSAIAELIDNAQDSDVRASRLLIDKVVINEKPCLVFLDNGAGMDFKKLHNMLSFKFCEKNIYETGVAHKPIGHFRNGFKSGSMRLGKDALVFTRCRDSASVGFLSQTFLERTGADCVIVPIVEYTLPGLIRSDSLGSRKSLNAILEYSIYKEEWALLEELKSFQTSISGTKIIIYNLKLQDGLLELDFASDPRDIRCPKVHKQHTGSWGETSKYKTSLREYCKILFLRPRMKIILRGDVVKSRLVERSLCKTQKELYESFLMSKPVNITIGFSCEKEKTEDYGIMLYHKNRLIKAYEKVGYQKQPNDKGVGVVGVVEVDFLVPTRNKQDFVDDEHSRRAMVAFGNKLDEYWDEQMKGADLSQTSNTGSTPDILWVQCDNCLKWRRLSHGTLIEDLPDKWFCRMNRDATLNRCDIPEEPKTEDFNVVDSAHRKRHKPKIKLKKAIEKTLNLPILNPLSQEKDKLYSLNTPKQVCQKEDELISLEKVIGQKSGKRKRPFSNTSKEDDSDGTEFTPSKRTPESSFAQDYNLQLSSPTKKSDSYTKEPPDEKSVTLENLKRRFKKSSISLRTNESSKGLTDVKIIFLENEEKIVKALNKKLALKNSMIEQMENRMKKFANNVHLLLSLISPENYHGQVYNVEETVERMIKELTVTVNE